ncbi:DMT family transporter [Actibacterium sp. 188UL27-1]|uniref:DMT family transporter n=1 Tax=Actibacterium sp. 188UL27-1 TaxID=2786961 RepID=UPI00195E92A8|nr:DMT family transporter [Actibacterium sp. 188UL27-1]MBM7068731.1 DMT family transporter [Actibacterium sp. 188UL27-1]
MRLFLLTTLAMVAFAANSVLNRLALADGAIGAVEFATIRVVAGALALSLLVGMRAGWPALRLGDWRVRVVPVLALTVYMFAFSLAYIVLDAGVGALILFGGVQVTMFAGAVLGDESVPPARWIGSGLALAGLGWVLWPTGTAAPPLLWSAAMTAAAVGWGVYSLRGRSAGPPLPATAANFAYAAPISLMICLLMVSQGALATPWGVSLAILSGVVTSGLGYALWYAVLPSLGAAIGALTQLSVPIIAMAGGMIVLDETLTWRFVGASLLVLGGIALGIIAPQRAITSKGS